MNMLDMENDRQRVTRCFSVIVFAFLSIGYSADQPVQPLDSYKGAYKKKLEEIKKEELGQNRKLLASYRGRVVGVMERYKKAGDLEVVQLISGELKSIDEGKLTIKSIREIPQLKGLQEILIRGFEPIKLRRQRQELTLTEGYLRVLEKLKVFLVKADKVNEAVLVSHEIEAAEAIVVGLGKSLKKRTQKTFLPRGLEAGLVLRYTFDEKDTDKVINHAASKFEGIVNGPQKTESAKFGMAYEFSSIADQISIEGELPDMDKMTFSAWIDNRGSSENVGIFSDYDRAGGNDVYLSILESSGVFIRADKDRKELKGMVSLKGKWEKGWNHLVWVMGRQDSKIYLNGEHTGSVPQEGSNKGHHDAYIGHSHDGSGYVGFKGAIDEVYIWRRCLSDSDVKLLYEYEP